MFEDMMEMDNVEVPIEKRGGRQASAMCLYTPLRRAPTCFGTDIESAHLPSFFHRHRCKMPGRHSDVE